MIKVDPLSLSSLPETDYSVVFQNNINCGEASVTVIGSSQNVTGSASLTFTITPREITGGHIVWANGNDYAFTGEEICPLMTTLREINTGVIKYYGTDYTTEYSNNINVGTATVIVRGIGNYTGQYTDSFVITPVPITTATMPRTSLVYTGTARTMTNATVVKAIPCKQTGDLLAGDSERHYTLI